MFIRRVDIKNYRGIKNLTWVIPKDQNFICMIGPGDSAKSSILEAVYLALCERWSLSLSDTDFFDANIEEPIVIRVALTELSDDIITHQALGLELSGIADDGCLLHDPEAGAEVCIVIQLKIDADLEPHWSAYREGGKEPFTRVGSGIRGKLAAFKVDERIDNHLRWSKSSALARMTEAKHGTSGTLAAAARASRVAVAGALSPELRELTDSIQAKLHEMGSGSFVDLQPGLDTSVPSSGGLLSLFEGKVPLTNFGLGSRRLAGISTQQLAYYAKTVLMIDEVEYGLEPHRLVHLLGRLRNSSSAAQAFVTTHSPVAVEQLNAEDFAVIRSSYGDVKIKMLRDYPAIQALLRSRPSAFLARKVVLAEGRTEYGLLLGLLDDWNSKQAVGGAPSSSALGVAVADGVGGVQAAQRAQSLIELGYEVVLFIDNDDRGADKEIQDAASLGCEVVRWSLGNATENQLMETLDAAGLSSLIELAVDTRSGRATVCQDIDSFWENGKLEDLDVGRWVESGAMTIEEARSLICKSAIKRKWFKGIDYGKKLASWVIANPEFLTGSQFAKVLEELRQAIYTTGSSTAGKTSEA
ncbi:ATP-dependent nuclease [Nocardia alba]|uniref:Putative ATP-dependent endonuclease of OLD family n=1 Tax=Nocardia alba TaxID=225051 RepID=A0A4R1FP36_9NOCA|nr:ATP-binding protein [Nocardia alba]TCJ96313.1 putative ATP-dependent endonuclease of OLD family [Nocardia alba]